MRKDIALGLAAVLVPAWAFAQQTKPASFDAGYGVILDRNPFLRDRHKPSNDPAPRRRSDVRPTRTAAQTFVLRGVTIEDAELHAYLEDLRGGSVIRVSPGDTLADGRIVDVAIDAIRYEANGKTQWVEVGQDLTGGRGGTADASTQPASTTAPAGGNAPPLPPGASIAERMKLRAQQLRNHK